MKSFTCSQALRHIWFMYNNLFYSVNFFKVAFCIACLVVVMQGCKKNALPTIGNAPISSNSSQKKMLALGDSYTIGQSVLEVDRFTNKTIANLATSGVNLKYPSQIIARTGWTTQNLLNELSVSGNVLAPPYDIVSLLIGVNDQFQNLDTAVYRSRFTMCLNKALEYSGQRKERVFVLSIPDYSVTPFGAGNASQISMEIDWFNAINKQVTLQMGISYTDITPSTRMAATDRSLIASDSLHPSGKEYLKWANMLSPKMLPFLQ